MAKSFVLCFAAVSVLLLNQTFSETTVPEPSKTLVIFAPASVNQVHVFKLCRFHFDLVYTTRTTVSICSGPRPTVVLSTRYKLEDNNEASDVYSEWAPIQVYSAGIKINHDVHCNENELLF